MRDVSVYIKIESNVVFSSHIYRYSFQNLPSEGTVNYVNQKEITHHGIRFEESLQM